MRSSLPVSTVLPSGLNATAKTVSMMRQGWSQMFAEGTVDASQNRAVLSKLPVITVLPSGLNATALDPGSYAPRLGWWAGPSTHPTPSCRSSRSEYLSGLESHCTDPAMLDGWADRLVPSSRP